MLRPAAGAIRPSAHAGDRRPPGDARPFVGALSGFFGIGGGFLIVPGIMLGSGMPILNAVGSSLLSVGASG